jgi:hypothetical protein
MKTENLLLVAVCQPSREAEKREVERREAKVICLIITFSV